MGAGRPGCVFMLLSIVKGSIGMPIITLFLSVFLLINGIFPFSTSNIFHTGTPLLSSVYEH